MTVAHDVFAETNPAFCAHLLATFSAAYQRVKDTSPESVLCYTALPIALSGDLAYTFTQTNRLTGLLEWLRRHPVIQIDLADRINASMDIVTEAIRFGCFAQILTISEDGRIRTGQKRTKKAVISSLSKENQDAFKHAERLGYWLAMAGSTRTTLDMMGLTV